MRDRILAADPGLTRLMMAARGTSSVATALGLLLGLCRLYHLPLTVAVLGAAICMTWSVSVSDPDVRSQRVTTVLMWFPAGIMLCAGTLTEFNRYLQDALFLAVLFAAVYVRRFGPRYNALGMISVLTFFFALFLRAKAQMLPWYIGGMTVSLACTYVYRFAIFKDRPAVALENALEAFGARQRLIEEDLQAAARRGRWTDRLRRRIEHHRYRLNETAIIIGDLLGNDDPSDELRTEVLETELETQAIVDRALENPCEAHEMPSLDVPAGVQPQREWTPRGPYRVGTEIKTGFLSPTTRQAIQLTAGATIAMAAGELLSPQRWYWAVLTTFLVFSGISSSGEALVKGWARVAGTAVGIAAGGVFAYVVRGHEAAGLVLMFVFLFVGVYSLRLSYGIFTFFLTSLLSMLYVLIGTFSDRLLVIRLVETVIGAACGGLAALVLLPITTRRVLGSVSVEALQRLSDVIQTSLDRMDGNLQADPLRAARAYDEALQSLRTQIEPLLATFRFQGQEPLRTRLTLYGALGAYGRALAADAYARRDGSPLLKPAGAEVVAHVDALKAALSGGSFTAQEAMTKPSDGGDALLQLYRIDRAIHRLAALIMGSS